MRRAWIVPLIAAAGLTLAAPAGAQTCEAPPGTAAVDQYCESIPSSRGETPTAGIDREAGGGDGDFGDLARTGLGGPELAAFVEQTRPARPQQGVRGQVTESAEEAPGNVVRVLGATAGGPTTGVGFLLAILAVLAGVGAWWWAQRRAAGPGGG